MKYIDNLLDWGDQLFAQDYRFDYMLERSKNITSTLIQLGSSLLSALEKKEKIIWED